MNEQNETEEESTFGKGLTYCLGLFLAHERDNFIFGINPDNISKTSCMLWFNASSDHLYDLVIPSELPKELRERLIIFKQKCLEAGHGFKGEVEYPTITWALMEAKELLRLIDEHHGIKTIEAEYK